MFRLGEPLWLILLIPILGGLVWSYRHVYGITKVRKFMAFGIRAVLASALVIALADPQANIKNEGLCTIFVLDRSESIREADREFALDSIRKSMATMGPKDQVGIVTFGEEAMVETSPGGRGQLGAIQTQVVGSGSNLAAAIRLASASFPDGKARRIVVLSDGNETTGDASEAAQVAATDKIPIDFVELGIKQDRAEALVSDLQTPSEARVGQPINLRAVVEATQPGDATLDLIRDDLLIKQIPVKLAKGRNAFVIEDKLAKPGFARYRVRLSSKADSDDRNNLGAGFVFAKGNPRVLMLQDDIGKTELKNALETNGILVDLAGPGGAPTRIEQLQRYDAVLFNDFNAQGIQVRQMQLIQSAVRDSGIGFAMIGGENSFLPGGYYGSPIAEILPVDLNVRQRKTFPSTTVLIMVDASGSMGMPEGGVPKIRLAAKAAEETTKLLSPMDRLGVAGSSDGIEWVAPVQELADREQVIAQIRRLDVTSGGIYIGPTVREGEKVMRAEPSKVRHIIILADGADSTDFEDSIERAAAMRRDKITITVVAIGDGPDVPQLKVLARAAGGQFFLANRADQLPAIFTQDTAIMSRSAIEEGAFLPKIASDDATLQGIASTPPLMAYCLTDSRPLAKTVLRTGKDDPLLARWHAGLGESLAFTSDAQSRWAKEWVKWDGFSSFWTQAIRSVSRQISNNQYLISTEMQAGMGSVTLKGTDRLGNPLTGDGVTVRVASPSGQTTEVALTQVGPGEFSGKFPVGEPGSYLVTAAEPDGAGGSQVSPSGFSLAYPAEYRTIRTNRALLTELAQTTSGIEITHPKLAFRPAQEPGASSRDLWSMFALIAACLLPLDIAVRRLTVPWLQAFQNAWGWISGRGRVQESVERVGRLQAAKQRAAQPVGDGEVKPVVSTTPGPPTRKISTPAPKSGQAAASSLLEAKRKRQEKE